MQLHLLVRRASSFRKCRSSPSFCPSFSNRFGQSGPLPCPLLVPAFSESPFFRSRFVRRGCLLRGIYCGVSFFPFLRVTRHGKSGGLFFLSLSWEDERHRTVLPTPRPLLPQPLYCAVHEPSPPMEFSSVRLIALCQHHSGPPPSPLKPCHSYGTLRRVTPAVDRSCPVPFQPVCTPWSCRGVSAASLTKRSDLHSPPPLASL